MIKDDQVTVPKWALEFILDRGYFDDCGGEEGWRSEEMERAIEALENAICDHPSEGTKVVGPYISQNRMLMFYSCTSCGRTWSRTSEFFPTIASI